MGTQRKQVADGVVMNDKKEILLVKQKREGFFTWSYPKGHVLPTESILEAAFREIKEETGIWKLTCIRFLGTYNRFKNAREGEDMSEEKEMHLFLFISREENCSPKDKGILEARWCSISVAEKLLTHPKDKKFLSHTQETIMNEWPLFAQKNLLPASIAG